MDHLIEKYCRVVDVSQWDEKSWLNSGGTRNKKIYASPDGEDYFFKESYKKGGKDYKYEFYSEIIASFIGEMMDLDILNYHLAFTEKGLGCLSKNMLKDTEELIEGRQYLRSFDSNFMMGDEKPKEQYNFQLIERALKKLELGESVEKVIDIIIFDALIGNSDRHQENWGFIGGNTSKSRTIKSIQEDIENSSNESGLGWIWNFFRDKNLLKKEIVTRYEDEIMRANSKKNLKFAPIYDSGCCFGREVSDEKVNRMLSDQNELMAFINRGKSEIYWEGEKNKCKHFELLKKLNEVGYNLSPRIKKMITKIDLNLFSKFLCSINTNIPQKFNSMILPQNRKELIINILTLRRERLEEFVK